MALLGPCDMFRAKFRKAMLVSPQLWEIDGKLLVGLSWALAFDSCLIRGCTFGCLNNPFSNEHHTQVTFRRPSVWGSLYHAPSACARGQSDRLMACRHLAPSDLSRTSCSTCLLATWQVPVTANKSPTTQEDHAASDFSTSHLHQPVSSCVSLIPTYMHGCLSQPHFSFNPACF